MSCAALYIPQLRSHGFRITTQRMAILHVLHHSGVHLSPKEVYRRASRVVSGLTEPTVYRTLEFLVKNGLALPAHIRTGHLEYEIAQHNHHHLVCRSCGKELKLDHRMLRKLYRDLRSSTGFELIDSHLTFFGMCPKCQRVNTGG
jgi:Fe2+ or Zn2+ uptake regulation protein